MPCYDNIFILIQSVNDFYVLPEFAACGYISHLCNRIFNDIDIRIFYALNQRYHRNLYDFLLIVKNEFNTGIGAGFEPNIIVIYCTDNDNQNENDGLLLKFLSGAAETLDKYLGEASRTIINQGLSDADAAILRIENNWGQSNNSPLKLIELC